MGDGLVVTGNRIDVGDVLRDPITGERREVVAILRPEDLSSGGSGVLPGSSAGRTAHYGSPTSDERRQRVRERATRRRVTALARGTCAGAQED